MTSDDDREAEAGGAEQLALIRETVRKAGGPRARPRTWRGAALAEELPVARVLVDKGLLHLDRLFDYAVPAAMDAEARPGVRVRVRFGAGEREGRREGGGLINGYVVERRADSDFPGTLAPIAQVLSPEPVLGTQLLGLCQAVADRYAGALADVVQLALPPRMARAEKKPSPDPLPPPPAPDPGGWTRYGNGPGLLAALADGGGPRAVWTALPGPGWPDELARALAAALASGRGALAVLPDGRAAARVDAALTALVGRGRHVLLTADAGTEARYRRWLAVSRGAVRGVVGTRAAAFAPVRDLGLAAIWDDADTAHTDDRAPQPHAREVLALRAAREHTALLVGGHACSVEAARYVESGWAQPVAAPRETVRAAAPLVRTVGDSEQARDAAARAARLPTLAWQVARDGLRAGPVLVQVPRRGYAPRLACARCRAPARCARCAGPLVGEGRRQAPGCGWCAAREDAWRCPACGGTRLRAQVVGARRTAEELGRAFPSVPVRTSGRDHVLAQVPDAPALVVSTPGAEPVAEHGYAAALLLDGWALLNRPDLRAGEEALRRWLTAAALVRGSAEGGVTAVVADPVQRPVQALVRWDPAGFARTELGERAELGFPPVSRMAAVWGPGEAVTAFVGAAGLPPSTEVLGPVPAPDPAAGPRGAAGGGAAPGESWERVLLRVPPGRGAALAAALKTAQAARMARRTGPALRIRIDPPDIG